MHMQDVLLDAKNNCNVLRDSVRNVDEFGKICIARQKTKARSSTLYRAPQSVAFRTRSMQEC